MVLQDQNLEFPKYLDCTGDSAMEDKFKRSWNTTLSGNL